MTIRSFQEFANPKKTIPLNVSEPQRRQLNLHIYIYKYIYNYIIFTFLGPIMEVFGAGHQGPPNHLGGPDIMSTLCSLQIRDPHLENAIASPVGLIYVRVKSW